MAVGLSAPLPGKIFLLLILISIKRLSKPQGLVRLEVLGKLENFIHHITSRTRDLPACSIVPLRHYATASPYVQKMY
jgi:hypothetical protein